MTVPPLADVPCVRINLDYTDTDGLKGGSRFFLSYSGSAPSGANCATLATDVHDAWLAHVAGAISLQWHLTEVDVLDIATRSGLSGQWVGDEAALRSGTALPMNCATNVEFGIARRYRGGKPRMFWPPPVTSDQADGATYNGSFITTMNSAMTAFFGALEALSVGSMGTLTHVNLSYYEGFTNITNSSGRERAVPTYRATALHDNVTGYSTKARIGSQKRRRSATTY
jgi:hypothetical protein